MKRLPTYYYLSHFQEFLSFIEGPCADLLHDEHLAFLQAFHAASKPHQCTLVRCINRKYTAIKISSLRFAELPNIEQLVEELIDMGWLAHPSAMDLPRWLSCLTKDELFTLYQDCAGIDAHVLNKSAPKSKLLAACETIDTASMLRCALLKDYVVRKVDLYIDYFLFLYFGNTKSRLNQFSLRDLGVMNTREERAQIQSRFDCKEAAMSSFTLSKYLSNLRAAALSSADEIRQYYENTPNALGASAEEKHQLVQFELAKAMLSFDRKQALSWLAQNDAEQAQEKWCREAYKEGDQESVRTKLEAIIERPLNDRLLAFAEDFLARKYQQKRTSVLTDMLREGAQSLFLDETFKGSVERGVLAHYKQLGIAAYRTENHLWRSLFGLTFWQELFDLPGFGLATQFDFLPQCLKQNMFYEQGASYIHKKLDALNTPQALLALVSKNAAEQFGKGQGIFHWRSDVLELISMLVKHAPLAGIKDQLLRMSKDWHACHDGFPDIMVLEQGKLRFEEIKAEGDVLRRNQLACIQFLKSAQFDVRISTVDFIIDPKQPYVVVDIETTGGRAGNHKITEIGMVKMIDGEIVDRWQSLLNPQRRIPANITALTGIDDDMVRDAPIFSDIADEVDAFTQDCIFVAHNVNFDYGFIKEEFARLERFWRRPKLCTVQQMRKHYKGLASYSLANLTRHFEIKMQRHHRAMSDALAASELLKLINEKRFAALGDDNHKQLHSQA